LPKNDEGEFELVLGNRQLISVFVIVVALLGVFFSFGYIVGRNSSPTAAAAETSKSNTDPHPAESPSTDGSSAAQPSDAPPANGAGPDDSARAQAPPSVTQPERPPAAPQSVKSAPATARESRSKPSPEGDATPASDRIGAGQPAGGQYWQVVATTRPDAEIIAEALARKGFHAVLAPAPKDGVYRVLVGPLGDASAQAQTRTNLEGAGFKNPILRKY
jgi:cytoskeletal protein RodZ